MTLHPPSQPWIASLGNLLRGLDQSWSSARMILLTVCYFPSFHQTRPCFGWNGPTSGSIMVHLTYMRRPSVTVPYFMPLLGILDGWMRFSDGEVPETALWKEVFPTTFSESPFGNISLVKSPKVTRHSNLQWVDERQSCGENERLESKVSEVCNLA